jgi:4-aminobutyrate aminotransferase-like enzyme
MDMERTMQFIVDTLANVAVRQQEAEVRMAKADKRMDRAEQRMDRAEQRMDRMERQMKGIQTLVKIGMRMMIDIQKSQKELAESQKRTEKKFDRWLDSINRGSNGHSLKSN